MNTTETIKHDIKKLIESAKYEHALKVLLLLLRSYPNDLDIMEMIGDCEFKLGMFGDALKLFIYLYTLSHRKDIRNKVKELLLQIRQDEKNVMDTIMVPGNGFVRGLLTRKLDSLVSPSMNILAEIAIEESNLSEARAFAGSAVRFGRSSGSGYYNLGIVEWLEGLKNKAVVNFARALSYEVTDLHATKFASAVHNLKQYENGVMIVNEILKGHPGNEILIQLRNEFSKNIPECSNITFTPSHNGSINKFDKINLLYADPPSGIYTMQHGLKTALERNGYLYYSFSYDHNEPLNLQKLVKYPILCINGDWEPQLFLVKMVAGKQFVANIQTESLVTRESQTFYYDNAKDKSKYFDLFFVMPEDSLNPYGDKPRYWLPSWVHTELFDDIASPLYDKIGFIGSLHGRHDFLSHDRNQILYIAKAERRNDMLEDLMEYVRLINKFKVLVSPMGAATKGMVGKSFEFMACKRLCLCYLDEKSMFKSRWLFEDGKDLVYFKTFEEMEEKYKFYVQHPDIADEIALSGYYKVRKFHNADVRAKRIAEIILHHANGGTYNESFDDIALFGGEIFK